jgi:hypothetical protein
MKTSDLFELQIFAKKSIDLLFSYANCSYDDFLLYGNSAKFEHAVKRLFYACFVPSIYRLSIEYTSESVEVIVYNSDSKLRAFSFRYVFSA